MLFFVVIDEICRVLIQVLPAVVVPHDSFRVTVLRHHLHLAVAEA
jgi:hypothetical protein